ncbi:FHA domain-containing protein [Dorea sp. D27]|uniref:FHA domain-containing protein n=1 Tax=Dorea sp. D27 TaxID=658665 RepID=UPI0006734E02|nr:FHA domain-containing protein [Dorea sp. D27]KMZ52966.1 transcriptional regulator, AfsR/DnrI/RedD family [Dorea sp. D27]
MNYLEGWKEAGEVYIPPLKNKGFEEDIILRKKIEPVQGGVRLIDREEEQPSYSGSEPTVFVAQTSRAYLKRLKDGETTELIGRETVIGKEADSDYIIKDNPTVSRHHARITASADGYFLEDLGSSNHTYVDGSEIGQPVKLMDGMLFMLSDEEFQFSIEMGQE